MKKNMTLKLLTIALFSLPVLGTSALVGCAATPVKESAGQYIDSSVITTKVKSALLADNVVKSLPITVKTYKNTVQLSGFVDNSYQAERAYEIAKNVEGVTDVRNMLLIKKKVKQRRLY